ncbi:unnamed protein product [Rotaria sp. Silwood1]|nr:unnamed protein product [Rotaria sp. Silwood1]
MFKFVCDGIPEMYPIKIDGQYHTDETDCEQWPCNNSYTYCNTVWNCPRGEDELTCNNTLIVCPALHHPCILPNTTTLSCLSIEKVHNGIVDCLGGSDERQLCRQMYLFEETNRYHCWNRSECVSITSLINCNTKLDTQLSKTISSRYSCRWKNLTSIQKHLCSLNDIQDYHTLEWSLSFEEKSQSDKSSREQKTTNSNPIITTGNVEFKQESCYRGVSIGVRTLVGLEYGCLCPPSLYGDHCEYQNQRVSLTVQTRSATDWRSIFTFIFLLMTDQNEIESYDYRYYNPSTDCAMKWNIYLLYQSRPKNPIKNYSVRIDVYKREAIMSEY